MFYRGESFRPDYLKVGQLQAIFDCPVLAMSATITTRMKDAIFSTLCLGKETVISASLPNRLTFTLGTLIRQHKLDCKRNDIKYFHVLRP